MSKVNIHSMAYDLVKEIINDGSEDYLETFDILTPDKESTDEEMVVIVVRRTKPPTSRTNVFSVAPDADCPKLTANQRQDGPLQ